MSQQSDKAKWDALAEMIGAKVSQPDSTLPQPRQEANVAPRIHVDVPAPARKRADWDALAGDLGVEHRRRPEQPVPSGPQEAPACGEQEAQPAAGRTAPPKRRDREERAVGRPTEQPASSVPEQETALEMRAPADEEAVSPDGERRPHRRRRRRGQRPTKEGPPSERLSQSEIDTEDLEEEPFESHVDREPAERPEFESGGIRASHKSIPSWSEAISIMIDGNLAGRSTRRRPGPGGPRTRGRRGADGLKDHVARQLLDNLRNLAV